MCKHGTEIPVRVNIPAHLSSTGSARWDVKPVDACIAPIVRTLNEGGILTSGCCCGHGKSEGSILLQDGRELIVRGPSHEGWNIDWVEQEHRMGCGIACCAMLTGKTYDYVRQWLNLKWFMQDGLSDWATYGYLAAHGYAVAPLLPHRGEGGQYDAPWPPKPFAGAHLCRVMMANMHLVVMTHDGTVLDPGGPQPRTLADYPYVECVAGVYRAWSGSAQ